MQKDGPRRRGARKGEPNWLRKLEPLFPRDRLRADISERGLTPYTAGKLAGVQAWHWIQGRPPDVPRGAKLRQVLETLDRIRPIDWETYREYLTAASSTVAVYCPHCRQKRLVPRRQLSQNLARRRAETRHAPSQHDGTYVIRCSEHAKEKARQVGRKALADVNRERYRGTRTPEERRRALLKAIGPEGRRRQRIRAGKSGKRPKGPDTRHKMAQAAIISAPKKFSLCRLCRLLVHNTEWHKICSLRWLFWCRRNKWDAKVTKPAILTGRPRTTLARDYRLLFLRQAGAERGELIEVSKREVLPYADRRSGRSHRSTTTITKAIDSIVRVLPGCWDLVFSPGGYAIPEGEDRSYIGAEARKASSDRRRKSPSERPVPSSHWRTAKEEREHRHANNRDRQERVPLPFATVDASSTCQKDTVLDALIEGGARDPLIQRLHKIRMPVDEIAHVTGAAFDRVRNLLPEANRSTPK